MTNLEQVSLIIAIGSAAGTVIASIAAGLAVKATRDGTRQQAYLALTQLLSLDADRRADRDTLMRLAPDDWQNWLTIDKAAARRYIAMLNVAAVFNNKRMLPRGILLEQYYVVMGQSWHHAGPWLCNEREVSPKLYDDYVRLAKEATIKCHKEGIKLDMLEQNDTPKYIGGLAPNAKERANDREH